MSEIQAVSARGQTVDFSQLVGKYLTFTMTDEEFALSILHVQEIIGMLPLTGVPGAPKFLRGVINLRGRIIPVIDMRVKFGYEATTVTPRTCIVVIEWEAEGRSVSEIGIMVEEVGEVLSVEEDHLDNPPNFGTAVDTDFIACVAVTQGKMRFLLRAEKIFSTKEVDIITKTKPA